MLFSRLVEYFDKLDKVSGRLEMTGILAELFEEVGDDEIEKVIYLILGQLGPNYARIEFNVAERMMLRVLNRAYDVEEKEVGASFKKVGDLGSLACELAKSEKRKVKVYRLKVKNFSVLEVYDQLLAIAEDNGQGSQERKVDGLAGLLESVGPLSAKYIARIPVGKLRLGFSEMTILDGLSWMVAGDKSLHDDLEDAYNVAADVGLIAKKMKGVLRLTSFAQDDKAGLESLSALSKMVSQALQSIKIQLGTPVVAELCQRLKSFDEIVDKMGEVAVEPKYDGTRLQIHWRRGKKEEILRRLTSFKGRDWCVRSFTRNLEENSAMFPELEKIGDQLPEIESLILDCEAIGVDTETGKWLPFQVTMTRKRKYDVEEQKGKVPLKFMVFDVLYLKKIGERSQDTEGDVHMLSLRERRGILEKIVKKGGCLEVAPQIVTKDPKVCRKLHEEYLEKGLEGVVVKKWDSDYVPGRKGWNWVKMKEVETAEAGLADTLDCVVMGYNKGKGQRAKFGLGAFLVGVKNDASKMETGESYLTVSKIGTGLTDEQFGDLYKRLKKLEVKEKPEEYAVDKMLEQDVWVKPELVVEIAGDNITNSKNHTSGYGLRFPRLVKFRDDKSPNQASSLKEVVKLFRMQK